MIGTNIIRPVQSVYPGGAEKVAWDPSTNIAYVVTGVYEPNRGGQVVAIDYHNGYDRGDIKAVLYLEGDVSDVNVSSKGLIAFSISDPRTSAGKVEFFKKKRRNFNFAYKGSVPVGYSPGNLSFTKNGKKLVVADEGSPLAFYGSGELDMDPPGSISIVKIKGNCSYWTNTLSFDRSNQYYENRGVRLFGFGKAGVERFGRFDIEPEHVSVADNKTAIVALQENNAIALVDLKKGEISDIFGLGFKSWDRIPVDTADSDHLYNPNTKNGLKGARMPDGIDTFKIKYRGRKETLIISPNEGAGRVRPDETLGNSFVELEEDAVYSYGTTSTGAITEQELIDELTQTVFYLNEGEIDGATSFVAENSKYFMSLKYGPVEPGQFWSDEVRPMDLSYDMSSFDTQVITEGRLKTLIDQNDPVTGSLVGVGGRGFSIHTDDGSVVYDSGNLTEEIAVELGYYPDNRSDDRGTEPETVEYFSFGKKKRKRHYIAIALERCYNNYDKEELGTIVPIFEIVDLNAADNDDRVMHVATLRSPWSRSPEDLLFVNDSNSSGHMFVTNEVSRTLDTFAISLSDLA